MTVLVTGATGFLGSYLSVALQQSGVVAIGRNEALLTKLAARGIKTVPLDLSKPLTQSQLDNIGPIDAIVHCAGLSSPWGRKQDFMDGNVAATRNLISAARAWGVKRFVYISTASVYFRFVDQDGLTELADLPRPINDYALTKRLAEVEVLKAADLGPVVLRPRGIYGAGDTALLPRLLRVARRRPIPVFYPPGVTDITHVEDVVAACVAALNAGLAAEGEIFNVTGGQGIELPAIIAAACHATDIKPRYRKFPFALALGATRLMEWGAKAMPGRPEPPVTAYSLGILRYRQTLDISKAARVLGWSPQIDFDDGLRRTFKGGVMRGGVL